MYWIHQVQDFEKWWAVVNTVLILQVLYIAGSFVTSWELEELLASETELCCMEIVNYLG